MQCIWTSTTNVLRRQARRTGPPVIKAVQSTRHRYFSWSQVIGLQAAKLRSKKAKLSSVADAFVSTAIRNTSIPPSSFEISSSQEPSASESRDHATRTAAQLSRIAAQSVRIACQGESTRDAFLIIKSLQASFTHYSKPYNSGNPVPQKVVVDFGMAVSPRLAMHTLLHALVRRGMTKKAGDIAHQILLHNREIHLRGYTLRLITSALCQTDTHALRDEAFRSRAQQAKSEYKDYLTRPLVAQAISGKRVQLPCTRTALQLFFAAKQYRKERAEQTFQQLIDACLLQGEILVVSFLFAFLVKQWEARLSKKHSRVDPDASSSTAENTLNLVPPSNLLPKELFLSQTVAIIDSVIHNRMQPDSHTVKPSYEESVQALAVLAGMLHDGLLPHSDVTALITALATFPSSTSVEVWTLRKGKREKWERRDAREYFDEVLNNFLADVTHKGYGLSGNSRCRADVRTFNSLLQYSLRRKKSPALAERILRRMQKLGGNVAPNITSFNIVLRSSTLLRRHDLSEKVLETLRDRPENEGHVVQYTPPERSGKQELQGGTQQGIATLRPYNPYGRSRRAGKHENALASNPSADVDSSLSTQPTQEYILPHLPPPIRRIFLEDFDLSCLVSSDSPLAADECTVVAYVDYLRASGRPGVVAKVARALIPELNVLGHPPGSREFRSLGRLRFKYHRAAALSRAVGLGPQFFTSVLNALVKDGKTGLARRVWRLAKAAEKCSWDPKYKTAPWVLPCAAYTVIVQCYAAEARMSRHRRNFISPGAIWRANRVRRILREESSALAGCLMSSADSYEVGCEMALLLLRSMQTSERIYRAKLAGYLEQGGALPDPKTIELPVPDERFFNAVLNLFRRHPSLCGSRTKKLSPCHWRRLDRRQFNLFIERGCVGFSRDDRLVFVLLAIQDAGFEVPAAFKHMLIGVTVPPSATDQCYPGRRVRTKHRCSISTPFRLPTSKDRGLPIANSLKVGGQRTPSTVSPA